MTTWLSSPGRTWTFPLEAGSRASAFVEVMAKQWWGLGSPINTGFNGKIHPQMVATLGIIGGSNFGDFSFLDKAKLGMVRVLLLLFSKGMLQSSTDSGIFCHEVSMFFRIHTRTQLFRTDWKSVWKLFLGVPCPCRSSTFEDQIIRWDAFGLWIGNHKDRYSWRTVKIRTLVDEHHSKIVRFCFFDLHDGTRFWTHS
jgi:hypothetical protein